MGQAFVDFPCALGEGSLESGKPLGQCAGEIAGMIAKTLVDFADVAHNRFLNRADALAERRGETFRLLGQTLVRFRAVAHERLFESTDRAADALGMLIQACIQLIPVALESLFKTTHCSGQAL